MTREERANDYAEHNIGKYTNDYANIYNAYLKGADEETKELKNENDELKAQLERAKVYLKATSDLLQKQNENHYVLNLLETTVFYDEADCDGYCLKDEIDTLLEMGV